MSYLGSEEQVQHEGASATSISMNGFIPEPAEDIQ